MPKNADDNSDTTVGLESGGNADDHDMPDASSRFKLPRRVIGAYSVGHGTVENI